MYRNILCDWLLELKLFETKSARCAPYANWMIAPSMWWNSIKCKSIALIALWSLIVPRIPINSTRSPHHDARFRISICYSIEFSTYSKINRNFKLESYKNKYRLICKWLASDCQWNRVNNEYHCRQTYIGDLMHLKNNNK